MIESGWLVAQDPHSEPLWLAPSGSEWGHDYLLREGHEV